MITRALILAAGRGVRVGDHGGPNCLTAVGRCTLIERTLQLLESLGVQKIAITVGWKGAELRKRIAASTEVSAAMRRGIVVFENAEWEKPNGLSVLAARSFITERTLLVMADQIAAPSLVRELTASPAAGDRTVLCIDRDLARVFDIEDATKVKLRGAKVVAIGKGLTATDQLRTVARQCYAWTLPYGIAFAENTDLKDGQVASGAFEKRLEMMIRDVRVYGSIIAKQRHSDLKCQDHCFMARHRK